MNTCPNCGMVKGIHASILPGCMCPFNDLTSLKYKQTVGPIESAMRANRMQDKDLMNVMRQAVFDTAEIDFKVEYYALLRAYSKQRDALEKASKEINEQYKLLQTATARIVDLQTHIENLEGQA